MGRLKRSHNKLRTFKPAERTIPQGVHLLSIEALADDGRGIARDKGKTIFVKSALPGEVVSARYLSCHKNFDEAEVVTVTQLSESRAEPLCPHFGQCGGCDLQHLHYSDQLQFKENKILHMLGKFDPGLKGVMVESISSSFYAYRHRAKFSVQANKTSCDIGFNRQKSNKVIPINSCELLPSPLNLTLMDLNNLLNKLKIRNAIKEILLVEDANTHQAACLRSERPPAQDDIQFLNKFHIDHKISLSIHRAGTLNNEVLWCSDDDELVYQIDPMGIELRHAVNDFTQINAKVNQALVMTSIDWLQLCPTDQVVDFFCGIGNFSLAMAQVSGKVTGIEFSMAMVKRARENAALNAIDNIDFYCGDLLKEEALGHGAFNKALIDPPRAGAQQLCGRLANLGVKELVYISCNPSTFFRDAKILKGHGYELQKIALADMFPQTTHCELIGHFCKLD